MKKLKEKIIRKELRVFWKKNSRFIQYLVSENIYPTYPAIPILRRHGFEIGGLEQDKAYLLYPDGKLKVVEI